MVVRDLLQRLSVETLVVVPLQMGQTARNMEGDGVKKKWSQWSGLKYSYDFQYRIKCSTIFLSCRGNHRNICSEPCPKTAVPAWLSYLISLVPVLSCVCNARSFWAAHPPRYDSYVRWCQKAESGYPVVVVKHGNNICFIHRRIRNLDSHFKEFPSATLKTLECNIETLENKKQNRVLATAEVWWKKTSVGGSSHESRLVGNDRIYIYIYTYFNSYIYIAFNYVIIYLHTSYYYYYHCDYHHFHY